MRLLTFAALIACPFVACYCTLSYANAAEPEQKAVRVTAKAHAPTWIEYLSVAKDAK